MKTITVLLITYNQEDVIRRALDSILSQKYWGLYQIIIGDDCSKDKTFDILLDYKERYPDIIRPYRNETNLGIFGNLQNLLQYRQSSDLYVLCSGDDAYCDGFFKSIQELIANEDVDLSEDVGIYSDWKGITPEGKEFIWHHNIVSKGYDLWRLHMRNLIGGRSLVISKSVINQYKPVIMSQGLRLAESLYDSQAPRLIKRVYYIPRVNTVYYTGIGVSKALSMTDYFTTQNIIKWNYYLDHMITCKQDAYYARYQITKSEFLLNPCFGSFLKASWYYILGMYPINYTNIICFLRETRSFLRYAITFSKKQ